MIVKQKKDDFIHVYAGNDLLVSSDLDRDLCYRHHSLYNIRYNNSLHANQVRLYQLLDPTTLCLLLLNRNGHRMSHIVRLR